MSFPASPPRRVTVSQTRPVLASRAAAPAVSTNPRRVAAVWLTWINLAAVAGLLVLLGFVSDRWWLGASVAFLPKSPFAIPAIVLLAATVRLAPWMVLVNAVSLVLVLVPIMGLTMPSVANTTPTETAIRVLSSNIQFGSSRPRVLLQEFESAAPDIVLLQEAHEGTELFAEHFADWQCVKVREFWVCSRWPVRLIGELHGEAFDRLSAIACEVRTKRGPVVVVNTHLATPRYSLGELRWHTPLTGAGVEAVEEFMADRQVEYQELRRFVDQVSEGRPTLVGGDFNTPAFTRTLSDHWTGFQNAFDVAGTGYGYTSPCNTNSVWPRNTPWVRIDHQIYSGQWELHSARIGLTSGSDHRLLYVDATPQWEKSEESSAVAESTTQDRQF